MKKIEKITDSEKENLLKYFNYLVEWTREKVLNANMDGVIVGISGGIDSALVSMIAKKAFPNNSIGTSISLNSFPQEQKHSKDVVSHTDIKYISLQFTEALNEIRKKIDSVTTLKVNDLAVANMKPRFRMMSLYYIAAKFNYLVLGTDNMSELYLGYFTKHGDGGVDLLPIANLTKTEVRKMALALGFSTGIVNQKPTADLWVNQSDEEEMDLSYETIDDFLTSENEIDNADKIKIKKLHKDSDHKRNQPPIPKKAMKDFK